MQGTGTVTTGNELKEASFQCTRHTSWMALSNTRASLDHFSSALKPPIRQGACSSSPSTAGKRTLVRCLLRGDHKCSIGLWAENRAANYEHTNMSRLQSHQSRMKNKAFAIAPVFQSGPPSTIAKTIVFPCELTTSNKGFKSFA